MGKLYAYGVVNALGANTEQYMEEAHSRYPKSAKKPSEERRKPNTDKDSKRG